MRTYTRQTVEEIKRLSSPAKHPAEYPGNELLSPYAWLEREGDIWLFLTNPFADPAESKRQWTDRQEALDELMSEGWSIVRPYPGDVSSATGQGPHPRGYGLKRILH